MKAAIIGGGVVDNYTTFAEEIKKCDFIICADGGIKHLINVDIPPNVFIGDIDSCDFKTIENLPIINNTEIILHDTVKDDTDMQLCIKWALNKGYNELTLFAALGGRIDHELSNLFNLKYILESNANGMIFSDTNRIYITDNKLSVKKEDGFHISLIPITDLVRGITLKGLAYSLENADLIQGTSLGVSNEFLDEYAEISITSGILLVIVSKDVLN